MSALPHWAVKGALVACVDSDIRASNWYARLISFMFGAPCPTKGQIVLIEETETDNEGAWLALAGFDGWLFGVEHFRPLVDEENGDEIEVTLYRKKHHRAPEKADA